jgi:hypothetical protein
VGVDFPIDTCRRYGPAFAKASARQESATTTKPKGGVRRRRSLSYGDPRETPPAILIVRVPFVFVILAFFVAKGFVEVVPPYPMKNILRFVFVLLLGSIAGTVARAAEAGPVYELRVYTVYPGKMPDLLARFRDHTRAIFERHGMTNVGYWLPVDPKEGDKLYYVLKHASREAATASWKAFGDDPEWQTVSKASEANGKIVSHVDSKFLTLTDYSPPAADPGNGAHVFELRTYTASDGKLDALDARFRDHTIALFARHGIASLFFWHPTDADKGAGKTLVYLLAHASPEAATKSWDAFHADPEWIKVKAESDKVGGLTIKDGNKSVFLTPTDFSAIK